jgi:hypothetical protein
MFKIINYYFVPDTYTYTKVRNVLRIQQGFSKERDND